MLSKNYITVQYASLIIGESAYQPIISKWVFKNVTMFPIPYYEYDCNTVCHKHFIMIHLLVYRQGYREAILSTTLVYHKAIILLLLCYQCMNHYALVNKYEFLCQIIFSYFMSSVSNTCNLYSVLYHVRQYMIFTFY